MVNEFFRLMQVTVTKQVIQEVDVEDCCPGWGGPNCNIGEENDFGHQRRKRNVGWKCGWGYNPYNWGVRLHIDERKVDTYWEIN